MSIQSVKLEIVGKILAIENPKILDQILSIVKSEKEDFWTQLSRKEKAEILEGLEQLDTGKRVPFEKVLKRLKSVKR